jgi:lipopolysaccharide biosynthesis glycosyltransferase
MSNNDSINVVLAADNNYAMPLAATIRSIVDNISKDRHLNIFILDGGIKEQNKSKILKGIDPQKVAVKYCQPSASLSKKINLPKNYHLPMASCLRILIPDLLKDLSKVIYLDCDLIVNTDLAKLWDIDMDRKPLLAVQDMGIPYMSYLSRLREYYSYSKLEVTDKKYFNSGVLVMDLKKWRANEISYKVMHFLEKKQKYITMQDQDALNLALADQWGQLEPKWNQQPYIFMYKSWEESPFTELDYNNAIHEPCIVHFIHYKPWNSTVHAFHHHAFYDYLDRTAWAGWRYRFHQRLWDKIIYKFNKLVKLIKLKFTTS